MKVPIDAASSPGPAEDSRRGDFRRLGLIALGYAFSLKLALFFPGVEGVLAAVWPPGGVALAALLLSPQRPRWSILAVIFLTGNVVNLVSGRPALASIGFMVANVLESWGSAWLVTRWCGNRVTFNRLRDVLALGASATAVNGVTALFGAAAARIAIDAPFYDFYRNWWIADGLGILLVTPLIVVCAQPWQHVGNHWPRRFEAGALGAVWCAFAYFGFQGTIKGLPFTPQPYWMLVPLVWVTLRFGPRATAVLLTLLAAISVGLTVTGPSTFPLGGDDQVEHLQMVQIYLGIVILMGLLLAAAVTERKLTERESRESELRFRTLFEEAIDGMLLVDPVTRSFTLSNREIQQQLGYSAAELRCLTIPDIHPPADLPAVMPIFEKMVRREANRASAIPMRRKDGSTFFADISVTPIRFQQKDYLLGNLRDITEHKRAEQRLKENEERLALALDQAHLAYWEMDAATTTFTFNDRFYALCGTTAEREGGYRMAADVYAREFLPPDEQHIIAADVARLLAGEIDYFQAEHRMRRRDGELRHLLVRINVVRDATGRVCGTRGSNQDITESKRAAEALRQSEALFRSVIAAMAEGVTLQSAEGTIIDCNLRAEQILGLSREQLLGLTSVDPRWKTVTEDGTPLPGEQHPGMLTLRTGRRCVDFLMGVNLPGRGLRWININSEPIIHPGEQLPHAVVATFADITEKRHQQNSIREMLKQAEADAQTKGELLREVNHRVTNNLTSVLGLIVYERENLHGADRTLIAQPLERLQQRIRGLLTVHSMLSQSAWAPVNLAVLADKTIRPALSAAAWKKEAVIAIEPTAQRISPRQAGGLALIFTELATNTAKYAGADSRQVEIHVRFSTEGHWTIITYCDNGPGYSTDVLENHRANVGLKLIRESVATTLAGQLELANEGGARCTIRLQLEKETRT